MESRRLNGIYTYSAFNPPKLLAENIGELINNVVISDNYLGNQTELFIEDIRQAAEFAGVSLNVNTKEITPEQADELTEQTAYYTIYVNPTFTQLSEYNATVGLETDTYIKEVFQCC